MDQNFSHIMIQSILIVVTGRDRAFLNLYLLSLKLLLYLIPSLSLFC
ncbi:hypothetical protein [Dendronalium sp. ChiSLP03b]|nr:hypothetical protein [Dendronalium sp. ChiSLP03b]